jgi:peptidoglycan/xylan/chitin deacetylase (PgdA/CDA1 family)
MYRYFVHPPFWLRSFYPTRIWRGESTSSTIYLTFDDGPHPGITPFVLEQLATYQAKATFFCIGDRVERYSSTYQLILDQGHMVGNHTMHHLNGWSTETSEYLQDIAKASAVIDSPLFRPPYGKMKRAQANGVPVAMQKPNSKIVMWDILSADFDTRLTGEDCFAICKKYLQPGSIIVMHDSEKAWPRISYLLPNLLAHASKEGFTFATIPIN